jgi:cbb3-type cytochrome oxidase subunit 3
MLTKKEEEFLQYWEGCRIAESKPMSKIARGFPMALLFSLPIVLSVIVVRIFLPEWYTKISKTSPGMFITTIFAMFLIALFYAFFRMHYKWEINEQAFKELKLKQANNNAAPTAAEKSTNNENDV